MTTDLILKASTIITMEDDNPRAEALGADASTGRITAIGSLAGVHANWTTQRVPLTQLDT